MLTIYTDASERNQHAVIGFTCYRENKQIDEQMKLVTPIHASIAEMLAILFALKQYPKDSIHFYSDSSYVVNVLNGQYKAKKHKTLWSHTLHLFKKNQCKITYVKGHAKNKRNNHIDQAVRKTLRNYMKTKGSEKHVR